MLSDFRVIIVYFIAFLLRKSLAICHRHCARDYYLLQKFWNSLADENNLDNNE